MAAKFIVIKSVDVEWFDTKYNAEAFAKGKCEELDRTMILAEAITIYRKEVQSEEVK